MSDCLSWQERLKANYKIHLQGETSCLRYVNDQRSGHCVVLKISRKVLLKWRDLKLTMSGISYEDLLALSAFDLPICIKRGNERIEEALRTMASETFQQSRGIRGNKRMKFLQNTKSFHVFTSELLNPSSLKYLLEKSEKEKNDLKMKLEEHDKRCEELFEDLMKEINTAKNLEIEKEQVLLENKELTEYLDFMEETLVCRSCSSDLENVGRNVSLVGERHRRRKVKELKNKSEQALWFMDSFGFKLDSIKVRDTDGNIKEMVYKDNDSSNKTSFQQLPEDDKDTIRALLYIMDKYCVSDSAYHEISMIVDGLPRSYLIKQCRKSLNSICHITRMPGKNPGAQLSFKKELQDQIRKKVLHENSSFITLLGLLFFHLLF